MAPARVESEHEVGVAGRPRLLDDDLVARVSEQGRPPLGGHAIAVLGAGGGGCDERDAHGDRSEGYV
jgi:hypothetical protein